MFGVRYRCAQRRCQVQWQRSR